MTGETRIENDEDKRTRIIPVGEDAPEGGWGWIIVAGLVVIYTTYMGPCVCYALIYSTILDTSSGASSALTTIGSIEMFCKSISGFLMNVMLKYCSLKQTKLVAVAISVIPKCMLPFVKYSYQLMIIAVFSGFGFGIMNMICCTCFNTYFIKKRSTAMSVVHSFVCVGLIVYPKFVEMALEEYGHRGTIVITMGLSLNCIPIMLIMHPLESHRRKPNKTPKEEIQEEIKESPKDDLQECPSVRQKRRHSTGFLGPEERVYSLRSLKEEASATPLLTGISEGSMKDNETIRSKAQDLNLSQLIGQMPCISVASLTSSVILCDSQLHMRTTTEESNEGKPMDNLLVSLKDVSLLKNWTFLNMCCGVGCTILTDLTFSSLLPVILINHGYSINNITLALTIGIIAEFISKLITIFLTMFINVKGRYLFFASMTILVFARLGFLYYSHTLIGVLVAVTIIGILRSWIFIFQFIVIIENFPVDKIFAAYGVYSVIEGILSIICGPFIGLVRDWTRSFVACQLTLIGMNAFFVVPWMLEFLMDFLKKRR